MWPQLDTPAPLAHLCRAVGPPRHRAVGQPPHVCARLQFPTPGGARPHQVRTPTRELLRRAWVTSRALFGTHQTSASRSPHRTLLAHGRAFSRGPTGTGTPWAWWSWAPSRPRCWAARATPSPSRTTRPSWCVPWPPLSPASPPPSSARGAALAQPHKRDMRSDLARRVRAIAGTTRKLHRVQGNVTESPSKST